MARKLAAIAVALVLLISTASAGFITSGAQYYVKHVGRRDCSKNYEFLGSLNQTCSSGALTSYGPTAGPILRGSGVKQWEQWTFDVVGHTPEGDDLVTIKSFYPGKFGKPLCQGNMVVVRRSACTSEPLAKNVHIRPNQPDIWRISKVKGGRGTHTITAHSRKAPCLRFLGGSSQCSNRYVELYAKDDASGQQRWVIIPIKPATPPSPSKSKPPPPSPKNYVEVPVVEYTIGITGYNTNTFGRPQKTAFCDSIIAATTYPKGLLRCVVASISNSPSNATQVGRLLLEDTAYVSGNTVFSVSDDDPDSLEDAGKAADGLANGLKFNSSAIFESAFPKSTIIVVSVEEYTAQEPLAPLPESPSPSISPPPVLAPPPTPESTPTPTPITLPPPSPMTPTDPATEPGRPTDVVAVGASPFDGTVSWRAPASNGGSPVLSYKVACFSTSGGTGVGPQTFSASSACSGIFCSTPSGDFVGLESSTSYTCRVVAINNIGSGLLSLPSEEFTTSTEGMPPPTVASSPPPSPKVAPSPPPLPERPPPPPPNSSPPGTPTIGTATGVTTSEATVSWTDGSTAGNPTETYKIRCVALGGTCTDSAIAESAPVNRGVQTATVCTLSAGAELTCFVVASNSAGDICSASGTDVTVLRAPSAPSAPTQTGITTSSWTATWTDGSTAGVPTETYKIRCVARDDTCGDSVIAESSPVNLGVQTATVSGLNAGAELTCFVVASNSEGDVCSASGTDVTVLRAPSAPSAPTQTGITTSSWTATWTDGSTAGVPDEKFLIRCVALGGACTDSVVAESSPVNLGEQAATVYGLVAGAELTCFVVASNSVSTVCSETGTTVLVLKAPSAPSAPTQTSITTSSWTASWTDGSPIGVPDEKFLIRCVALGGACTDSVAAESALVNLGEQAAAVYGLVAGAELTCFVVASNSVSTVCSETGTTVLVLKAPSAPSAPTQTGISSSSWKATWTDGSTAGNPTETYKIRCVTLGGTCTDLAIAESASVNRGVQSAKVSCLSAGAELTCFVVASNSAGDVCSVSGTSVTVPSAPSAPSAPTQTGITTSSWTATWTDGSTAGVPTETYKIRCVARDHTCSDSIIAESSPVNLGVQTATVCALSAGAELTCFVVASNSAGDVCSASGTDVTVLRAPSAPSASTQTGITTSSWTASWTDGSTAGVPTETYKIRCVARDDTCGDVVIAESSPVNLGVQTATVSGLNAGAELTCFVVASNSEGDVCSASGTDVTVLRAPSPPSAPTQTGITTSSWTATWTDGSTAGVPDEQLFIRCVARDDTCGDSVIAESSPVNLGVQTATVSGLTAGADLTCFVVASNSAGVVCSASGTDVTVLRAPSAPSAPTQTGITTSSWTATWTDGSTAGVPTETYKIRCVARDDTCGDSVIAESSPVNLGVQTATVSGLNAGAELTCFVVASNSEGDVCSASGTDVTVLRAPSPPSAPTQETSFTPSSWTASWDDGILAGVPTETYKIRCVARGGACGALITAESPPVNRGVRTATVSGLSAGAQLTCFVVASNSVSTVCSATGTDFTVWREPPTPLNPFEDWSTNNQFTATWVDGSPAGVPTEKYRIRCFALGGTCDSMTLAASPVVNRGVQTATVTYNESFYTGSMICFVVASNFVDVCSASGALWART